MLPFTQIWLLSRKALNNDNYLTELLNEHSEQFKIVNKNMKKLKKEGHQMGEDLRNKIFVNIHIPNHTKFTDKTANDFKGVMELKTIMLHHKITSSLIKQKRNKVEKIAQDDEHIDKEFAEFATICKDFINTSRIIKQVEMARGDILRTGLLSIKHNENKFEYF